METLVKRYYGSESSNGIFKIQTTFGNANEHGYSFHEEIMNAGTLQGTIINSYIDRTLNEGTSGSSVYKVIGRTFDIAPDTYVGQENITTANGWVVKSIAIGTSPNTVSELMKRRIYVGGYTLWNIYSGKIVELLDYKWVPETSNLSYIWLDVYSNMVITQDTTDTGVTYHITSKPGVDFSREFQVTRYQYMSVTLSHHYDEATGKYLGMTVGFNTVQHSEFPFGPKYCVMPVRLINVFVPTVGKTEEDIMTVRNNQLPTTLMTSDIAKINSLYESIIKISNQLLSLSNEFIKS